MSEEGTVCVITGASSGIGSALARLLHAKGVSVVLLARRADRLKELENELKQSNAGHQGPSGGALGIVCDVGSLESVKQAAELSFTVFGHVDWVVNNAGIALFSLQKNANYEDSEKMVNVNCLGVLRVNSVLLPHLRERKRGHIINVSSDADRKTFPGSAVYSATKAFVSIYSESLRSELVVEGLVNVRVSSISSGSVGTELCDNVPDQEVLDGWKNGTPSDPLSATEAAGVIDWCLTAPSNVNINNVLFRPIGQAN
jgi:NADP-dependent 3-hydroxy acid dehydrogenase YdfG